MANLTEVSQWENVIRQIENGEAATGGADGLANIQAKQLANRTKWLKENCLPLTGGSMKGQSPTITRLGSDKTGAVVFYGGNGTGARASLFDEDNASNGGCFNFRAKNSGGGFDLCGFPSGRLDWGVNDLAGSAIVAKSLGTNGYVKYASGLIIQWKIGEFATFSNGKATINFPISFSHQPSVSFFGCEVIYSLISINASAISVRANYYYEDKAVVDTGTPWSTLLAIGY